MCVPYAGNAAQAKKYVKALGVVGNPPRQAPGWPGAAAAQTAAAPLAARPCPWSAREQASPFRPQRTQLGATALAASARRAAGSPPAPLERVNPIEKLLGAGQPPVHDL